MIPSDCCQDSWGAYTLPYHQPIPHLSMDLYLTLPYQGPIYILPYHRPVPFNWPIYTLPPWAYTLPYLTLSLIIIIIYFCSSVIVYTPSLHTYQLYHHYNWYLLKHHHNIYFMEALLWHDWRLLVSKRIHAFQTWLIYLTLSSCPPHLKTVVYLDVYYNRLSNTDYRGLLEDKQDILIKERGPDSC